MFSASGEQSGKAGPEASAPMQQRVFVGGISFQTEDHQLRQFFESFGTVLEAKIIRDRDTGASKGYGFVTFADAATAQNVREKGHLAFMGKTMNVGDAYRKSRDRPPVPPALSPAGASGVADAAGGMAMQGGVRLAAGPPGGLAAAGMPYMIYAAPPPHQARPHMYTMPSQQYSGMQPIPYVYYIPAPMHVQPGTAPGAGVGAYQMYPPQAFYTQGAQAYQPPRQPRPPRHRPGSRQQQQGERSGNQGDKGGSNNDQQDPAA